LYEKTGIVYELYIISEAAANGSILCLESDMILHDRSAADTKELHLPMAYVNDLFNYHYMPNSKVGYMINHPGDLSGQLANFVSFFNSSFSIPTSFIQPTTMKLLIASWLTDFQSPRN
jgi:hypothetical protein